MAIVLISGLFILLILFLLSLTEHAPFLPILFKVVSVFGTVGLSMSLTLDLSEFGKWVIMCVMFFGKVGMLTLTFSIPGVHMSIFDIRMGDLYGVKYKKFISVFLYRKENPWGCLCFCMPQGFSDFSMY